ncbi:MAG: hypothetical protein M1834_006695 [Cirrosporium novae-zelandiae]|nr:MAG: hypothetical protein M1834_006695 [Cirrosporium novae-zelandiae]
MFAVLPPRMNLKRDHGQIEDESEVTGLQDTRYQHKRIRSLPLRISPTMKHLTLYPQSHYPYRDPIPPPTPLDSPSGYTHTDPDDMQLSDSDVAPNASQPTANSLLVAGSNMEVDDNQLQNSPHHWNNMPITSRDGALSIPHITQNVSGGRVATPISGHFDQDIRMGSDNDQGSMVGRTNSPIIHVPWKRWKEGGIPSPVREDENSLSPTVAASGMLNRLAVSNSTLDDHGPRDTVDTKKLPNGKPATGKLTLSMGYRADCEKCRKRVPGHYSHWVQKQ